VFGVRTVELAASARFESLSLDAFVYQLASARPTPGGGSASAVVAALGASLVSMVAALSEGHAASVLHSDAIGWAGAAGRDLAARFLAFADEDAAAFERFDVAIKMPRGTEEQKSARAAAIRAAARAAADSPLSCLEACLDLARSAETLAGRSNPNLESDLVVASWFVEAAAEGAAENIRVNLPLVRDAAWETATAKRLDTLLAEINLLTQSTRDVIASRLTRRPVTLGGRLNPADPSLEALA
jgi:formiminotetrahydrofolate cyclodeaminase